MPSSRRPRRSGAPRGRLAFPCCSLLLLNIAHGGCTRSAQSDCCWMIWSTVLHALSKSQFVRLLGIPKSPQVLLLHCHVEITNCDEAVPSTALSLFCINFGFPLILVQASVTSGFVVQPWCFGPEMACTNELEGTLAVLKRVLMTSDTTENRAQIEVRNCWVVPFATHCFNLKRLLRMSKSDFKKTSSLVDTRQVIVGNRQQLVSVVRLAKVGRACDKTLRFLKQLDCFFIIIMMQPAHCIHIILRA
mmetsp:Transcript_16090/g.37926  ORF Transcript_16090/g.37926 Transcript_16090/m.37926 type:complete len:247 (+) Transcript_16090:109-849(+)